MRHGWRHTRLWELLHGTPLGSSTPGAAPIAMLSRCCCVQVYVYRCSVSCCSEVYNAQSSSMASMAVVTTIEWAEALLGCCSLAGNVLWGCVCV